MTRKISTKTQLNQYLYEKVLWQAELTFIHNYLYQQFELVISLFGIIDITNLNC